MRLKGFPADPSRAPIDDVPKDRPADPEIRYEKRRILLEGRTYVRVFQEDEVLRNDPTATKVEDAFRGFLGDCMTAVRPDLHRDEGDSFTDVYRGLGAIVCSSFDGSSLYLDETRLPCAALFGSRWEFETWKRVADGLRSMRDPDPHFSSTYRLVGLGDYAGAIAGELQNQRPMSEAEVQEAARLVGDFEKQIVNVTEELQKLAAGFRRRLDEAKRATKVAE
jgi:hypothetical protein